MWKIHPGFIALAVLLGPAALILSHEKITRSPAQQVFEAFDPPPIVRQAYTRCAETPKTQRSQQCDEYVSFFEQCAARTNECGPQSVYEVLTKLILEDTDEAVHFVQSEAVQAFRFQAVHGSEVKSST